MRSDGRIVFLIIGTAFVARAIAIWLTRPEFVGWFNHSYYYWVQTRGVLRDGQLPFADLPLLFYLYAGIARLAELLGLETAASIVHASRGLMSIVPALVALPVYAILRRVFGGQGLRLEAWLLVVVAAFLPLTFAHMPELLQKNAAGLLLLATLMHATYAWLQSRRRATLIAAVLAFSLIALTHLGTLAVSLLFLLALALAAAHEWEGRARPGGIALLLIGATGLAVAILAFFDSPALVRVLRYAASSLPNSLVGSALSADSAGFALLLSAGIIGPALLAWLLYRAYLARKQAIDAPGRVFWLACLLWSWLLVFPLIDLDIVPRFVLFLPLPALVVAAFHFRCSGRRNLRMAVAGIAAAGSALMVFGETINIVKLYPEKDEIHAELRELTEAYDLSDRDFVLTQYAVNTACNWFLGTSAGLITAFKREDFDTYDRVFVLNLPNARIAEDDDTRGNIPMPAGARGDEGYEHLQWYALESVPGNWHFDDSGGWSGWNER